MKDIKNYRVLELRYFGATNHHGSRVKVVDHRWNESKYIPKRMNTDTLTEDAIVYLESIGIPINGRGEGNRTDANKDFLFTDNFHTGIDGVEK